MISLAMQLEEVYESTPSEKYEELSVNALDKSEEGLFVTVC